MVIVEVLNESAQVLIHSAVKSFPRIETFLLFQFNFSLYVHWVLVMVRLLQSGLDIVLSLGFDYVPSSYKYAYIWSWRKV